MHHHSRNLQRQAVLHIRFAPSGEIALLAIQSRSSEGGSESNGKMALNASPEMDGFADLKSLKSELYSSSSFYLGNSHPDHGKSFPIGIDDDRHIFIAAGSRAGKGLSLIVNNLIAWEGGLFCIDPKGENASLTAMRRGTEQASIGTATSVTEFLGQEVAVLDPLGCVKGPAKAHCVRYDPLSDIDMDAPESTAQILSVAESIVIADHGEDSHFTDSAEIILAGVIELVMETEKPDKRTLLRCREIILEGFGDFYLDQEGNEVKTGLIEKLDKVKTPAALAQEAYSLLTDTGDDERGSFRSTLARQMRWMSDERMLNHLKNPTVSLRKIIRENGSVFVCLPPLYIPRMKRWLRSIVNVALETKMLQGTDQEGQQSLFMLDEFPALGHFKLIEEAAGYMAGYNIKLVPVIQNIGQVKKLYDKNWETFLGNAGAIIGWGLNDHESETYFADRMGQRRSLERSIGSTAGAVIPIRKGRSQNWAMQDRPLRWPNEIRAQGARETMRAFVITAKGAPFTIQRVNFDRPENVGKYDSESFVKKWEFEYGSRVK